MWGLQTQEEVYIVSNCSGHLWNSLPRISTLLRAPSPLPSSPGPVMDTSPVLGQPCLSLGFPITGAKESKTYITIEHNSELWSSEAPPHCRCSWRRGEEDWNWLGEIRSHNNCWRCPDDFWIFGTNTLEAQWIPLLGFHKTSQRADNKLPSSLSWFNHISVAGSRGAWIHLHLLQPMPIEDRATQV